jgi:hypothetical protein
MDVLESDTLRMVFCSDKKRPTRIIATPKTAIQVIFSFKTITEIKTEKIGER